MSDVSNTKNPCNLACSFDQLKSPTFDWVTRNLIMSTQLRWAESIFFKFLHNAKWMARLKLCLHAHAEREGVFYIIELLWKTRVLISMSDSSVLFYVCACDVNLIQGMNWNLQRSPTIIFFAGGFFNQWISIEAGIKLRIMIQWSSLRSDDLLFVEKFLHWMFSVE